MAATRYSSALLDFLPRPCREQTCLFRFFRGALALYLYIILRQPGVGTTEKTMFASCCVRALLNFSPHLIGSTVKGSRQLCCRGVELKRTPQLLTLRCGQRSLVGAIIDRPLVTVSSVPTGRATAKTVSAQCECAIKNALAHTLIIHHSLFIINFILPSTTWG